MMHQRAECWTSSCAVTVCIASIQWQSLLISPETGMIRLRADVVQDALRFSYAIEDGPWNAIPMTLDHSMLSDEAGDGGADANFTGAFVGICCQDLQDRCHPADFSYFEYKENS